MRLEILDIEQSKSLQHIRGSLANYSAKIYHSSQENYYLQHHCNVIMGRLQKVRGINAWVLPRQE